MDLKKGTPLCVQISREKATERWLVSKIISIDGEPYNQSKKELEKKISKNKSTGEDNVSANLGGERVHQEFPDLDQRYVFNSVKGRSRRKIPIAYGLNLISEDFLRSWQDNSYLKISEYSETVILSQIIQTQNLWGLLSLSTFSKDGKVSFILSRLTVLFMCATTFLGCLEVLSVELK